MTSKSGIFLLALAIGLSSAVSVSAQTQGSITGVVKDASGGVLPGVSVEAASPALIEKTRTAVTDGSGQYRLESLRPGTYTVTFSLEGFNGFKREGIELSGSFTATVNAELKVGALEETLTVSAQSPLVDVQSVTKQRVMTHEVIDAVPLGAKNYYSLAVLQPGVTTSAQDVGGFLGDAMTSLSVHGSKNTDFRPMQNGVPVGTLVSSGGLSGSVLNSTAAQEVTIDTAGLSADLEEGGPRINYVPRDGGNRFSGTTNATFSTAAMQASNLTQRLKDAGLPSVDSIKTLWEVSPGLGGPLKKDSVWFYVSGRYTVSDRYVGGMWVNKNARDPNPLISNIFNPDLTTHPINSDHIADRELRLTWQTTPKLKLAFHFVDQARCGCPASLSSTQAPEAGRTYDFPISRFYFVDFSAPITNHLLVEGTFNLHVQRFGDQEASPDVMLYGKPSISDQATGITYGARANYQNIWDSQPFYRWSATYITGAHSFKVGMMDMFGYIDGTAYHHNPLAYRLNNGVINQLTERAFNYAAQSHSNNLGIFAQDKWTIDRLTLSAGLRFDYFGSGFPDQVLGPGLLFPNRNVNVPATSALNWKDITPRLGVVYNLFGSGRTAIRASASKYLLGQGLNGLASNTNPINTLSSIATRSWTDTNRNGIPDCDLLNPAANSNLGDACGALSDQNFGSLVPGATYDPNLLGGWGHRNYNWEFSAGVQHQLLPRMSIDVAYFRRLFGNFWAVDNLALAASDFDQFTIAAPVNPNLPNGGGYPVTAYDLNPSKFGVPAKLYSTLSDTIGEWTDHWNGFDVGINARMSNLLLQGGISVGRRTADNCDVTAKVPEMLSYVGTAAEVTGNQGGAAPGTIVSPGTWQSSCRIQTPWSAYTQSKLIAHYTIPKIDVQLSGTWQSIPGPQLAANYAAPNSVVAPALGRPLSGGAANTTINLVPAGTVYGDRLQQLDMRIGKRVPLGEGYGHKVKGVINLDVYNVTNTDVAIATNANYATLYRPTQVLPGRFMKIGFQVDF